VADQKFVNRGRSSRGVEYPVSQGADVKKTADQKGMPNRVRFSGAQRVPVEDLCRIRVRLQSPDGTRQVGVADGPDSPDGELRAAAEATLQALRQAAALKDARLDLREVSTFDAFDKPAVMVSVSLDMGAQSRTLLGFSPLGSDPPRAAALAVLSATNRFITAVLA